MNLLKEAATCIVAGVIAGGLTAMAAVSAIQTDLAWIKKELNRNDIRISALEQWRWAE